MEVSATADGQLKYDRERKALTGEEAGRILEAAADAKNMTSGSAVLIFEHGRLQVANVYRKVG